MPRSVDRPGDRWTALRCASRYRCPALRCAVYLLLLLWSSAARAEEFIYLGSGPLLGDRARQRRSTTAPPAGWQGLQFDDSAWGLPEPTPTSATDGGAGPPCSGTLYLRRSFDVGPELPRLSGLALRLRYEDGFAAYINGVEVARKRLPEAALTDALTLASDRSPTETESYYATLRPGLLRPLGNVLALEIHPRTAERCARVDAELSAADGARIVRGPYLERVLENAADIAVESDVSTTLVVRYGKGESRTPKDRQVRDKTAATLHRIHLQGLKAGTTYHYQIGMELPSGAVTDLPEAAFHTPPARGRPLRFVVYGDSRSGHDTHQQLVRSVLAEDPDLVLVTGDVVERGTEEGDWDRFFRVAAPLLRQVPLYLTPGNHEYARRGLGAQRLFELFATTFTPQGAPPGGGAERAVPRGVMGLVDPDAGGPGPGERGYYSFDVSDVHFVSLDSNQYRSPRQREWFEEDLRRAAERRSRGIFVFTHDGPYSSGWHGDNAEAIRSYVPVMERYRVTMLFSGHDHDYERGRRGGLSYIVTGGAGAELRPLKCGAPGKKRCKHPPLAFVNDHNYVRVEVLPGMLKVCARRIDGTPLEACQTSRLSR